MKKSARVLEKLVSPGLPGLQVATRLEVIDRAFTAYVGIFLLSFSLVGRRGGGVEILMMQGSTVQSHEITEFSILTGSLWGTIVAVHEIINSKIRLFILGLRTCGKARVGL